MLCDYVVRLGSSHIDISHRPAESRKVYFCLTNFSPVSHFYTP